MSSRESQRTWGIHTYTHTQIHTVQKYTCKTGSHTKSLATLGSHMSACTHEVIPQVTGSNRLHWENISGRVVCSAMLMKAPYSPHFPLWWAKLFNYRGKPCPEDSALSAGKCWAGQGQRRIPWHWSHTTGHTRSHTIRGDSRLSCLCQASWLGSVPVSLQLQSHIQLTLCTITWSSQSYNQFSPVRAGLETIDFANVLLLCHTLSKAVWLSCGLND